MKDTGASSAPVNGKGANRGRNVPLHVVCWSSTSRLNVSSIMPLMKVLI